MTFSIILSQTLLTHCIVVSCSEATASSTKSSHCHPRGGTAFEQPASHKYAHHTQCQRTRTQHTEGSRKHQSTMTQVAILDGLPARAIPDLDSPQMLRNHSISLTRQHCTEIVGMCLLCKMTSSIANTCQFVACSL